MSAPRKKPAAVARKSSATIPKASGNTFYTGPTVAKQDGKPVGVGPMVPIKEGMGGSKGAVKGKNLDQIVKEKNIPSTSTTIVKRTRTPQRTHRFLNTSILLILLASLFSLYACPSSTTSEPTLYTRLNPFVITPHLVPGWERALCRPANAWREEVLEPYIVPRVTQRVEALRRNVVVREYVEPALLHAQRVGKEIWRTRLGKPVTRLRRTGEKLWNRYIAPWWPVVRATAERIITHLRTRFHHATASLSARISSHPTYRSMLVQAKPHYRRIHTHTTRTYKDLVPRLQNAGRTVQPHAVRIGGRSAEAGRRGVRAVRERVVPRVARSLEVGLDRAEEGFKFLSAYLRNLYETSIHPLLHPHYSTTVAPHIKDLHNKIYQPYLHVPLQRLRPLLYSLVLTPSMGDIRRSLRAGYLDTRAAVGQGVESVKEGVESVVEAVGGAGEKAVEGVEGAVKGVKDKVVPSRDYRGEAIDKARLAAEKVQALGNSVDAEVTATASSIIGEVKTTGHAVVDSGARVTASVVSAAGRGSAQVEQGILEATASGSSVIDQATKSVGSVVADVRGSASSVVGQASGSAVSVASQVSASASSVGAEVSGKIGSVISEASRSASSVASQASSVASHVSGSASSVVGQVSGSAASVASQASGTIKSVSAHASGSVSSVASQVSGSAASVSAQASGKIASGASQASGTASSVASQVSGSAASVAAQASGTASFLSAQASGSAASVGSQASYVVSQASGLAAFVGGQVSGSAASVASQVSGTASSVGAQASKSVSSAVSAAQGSASSVASRAASAVEPNASTLDPLDPSATEIGSNPGKTTIPKIPGQEPVAQIAAQDEVVAKDPTYIKQEAAGALHAYLQTQVPQIAQDRLTALEREATAVTRAFQQLLGRFELSPDTKDVAAERVKVKASLKKVRAKLDDLAVVLEKDLQGGLINAGAEKEVDKLIDAAVASAGKNAPSTLRKSYQDIAQSVLETLNNVNDAVAQEGRLVLKPYRKDAKDRADQALALLDGKATVVLPSETVGQVAQAAASTIGRAKDQIIADIKQATESGSSVYQSVTEGAAHAAGTAASKAGLHEQVDAVLAGLADFRREVEQVVEGVTSSGKSGAARATQAVKDEL